ncbi:MAG: hypothetical protein KA181_07205 [Xylophilus sp.]|nr:hypothetical protein [Xylophilus sp.]
MRPPYHSLTATRCGKSLQNLFTTKDTAMKKLVATVALIALSTLSMASHAAYARNGVSLNGVSLNGLGYNGLSLNGLTMNGMVMNGATPSVDKLSTLSTWRALADKPLAQ